MNNIYFIFEKYFTFYFAPGFVYLFIYLYSRFLILEDNHKRSDTLA